MYQYTNKHNRSVAKNSSVKHTPSPKTIPNSAMLAGISTGDTSDFDLDRAMMQKMNALMNQIPAAEQEADRLSRGVHSTSFEGIREEMGQRLGADLSEIRLHTDAAAAEQADQIGAVAYTTGKDIYWGSGGFKPETMAHELVHTVQQGAVAGETSAAVPMGTVQMEPRTDADYLELQSQLENYNSETDPVKKMKKEQLIMSLAANYMSKYSTLETPEEGQKELAANAEKIIHQLSATEERQRQAQQNLSAMDGSIKNLVKVDDKQSESEFATIKGNLHSTVENTMKGIQKGEILDKQLSPALLAILTETMAGQSADTTLNVSTSGGQFTGGAGMRPPEISIGVKSDSPLWNLVPGFFHEATHGYADQVYGSIVTMPQEKIWNEEMVRAEEKERADTAAKLLYLTPGAIPPSAILSPDLSASLSKIAYATKAGVESIGDHHYFERALAGFEDSGQDSTPLLALKMARDHLTERAVQEKLEKTGVQSKYDKAVKEARTEHARNAARTEYDSAVAEAQSDYNTRYPTMIEYDPTINEALMRFELSGGNQNSLFYRTLKAAALQSHVKRHNANVEKQLQNL